jgi:hypothetical protein
MKGSDRLVKLTIEDDDEGWGRTVGGGNNYATIYTAKEVCGGPLGN